MLQSSTLELDRRLRFDLAPTGALCYRPDGALPPPSHVLISLPQERCATRLAAFISDVLQF